jgi:hypothetical protein
MRFVRESGRAGPSESVPILLQRPRTLSAESRACPGRPLVAQNLARFRAKRARRVSSERGLELGRLFIAKRDEFCNGSHVVGRGLCVRSLGQ